MTRYENTYIILLIASLLVIVILTEESNQLQRNYDTIYIRYKQAVKKIEYQDSICELNNIHIKSLHHLLNYKPLRHLKPKADSLYLDKERAGVRLNNNNNNNNNQKL